jgi:hypothetical protein
LSTVVLVQALPRNPATGTTVAVRLAGGGSKPYNQLEFTDWRAGVANVPRFTTAIGFDQTGWTGGALPQTAGIRFASSDRAFFSQISNLYWTGAQISVQIVDDETGDTQPPITGTVASAKTSGAVLTITIADLSVDLNKSALPDTFAGTGNLEGGDEATGRVKRRTWGAAFNIEGRVLDKANNVFEFGDPNRPLNAFPMVKDKGREASSYVDIAWQGTALATLNALRVAVAPSGGCARAPSIACVKWWTVPAGPLTADIQGEVGAGYVQTAPAIVARIVSLYSTTITVANLAQAVGWKGAVAGIHVDDANETVANLLDRLLLPVSLVWILAVNGALSFQQFTWTGPVEALVADTIERQQTFNPLKTRRVGFQRNYRVHNDAEISATLLTASDLTYADGTPLEVLKPAQGGADVTGENVSSGFEGQDWGATAPEAAASNALVPTGANTIVNSGFARGSYAFQSLAGPVLMNLPGYFGRRQVAYVHPSIPFGAGAYFDISALGWWDTSSLANMRKFSLPVKLGDRVGVRCLIAGHRCLIELYLLILDAQGGFIRGVTPGKFDTGDGGLNGDGFMPMEQIYTIADSNAAYVEFMIRATSNGEADPYVFFSEPWRGKLGPGQTTIPAYTHGPADPIADKTNDNVAGSFEGQGELSTLDAVGYAQLLIETLSRRDTDIDNGSYTANQYGQTVQATGLLATVTEVQSSGDLYIDWAGAVGLTPVGSGQIAQDSFAFVRVTAPNGTYSDRPVTSFASSWTIPATMAGTWTATAFARRGTTNVPAGGDNGLGSQSPWVTISAMTLKVVWRAI